MATYDHTSAIIYDVAGDLSSIDQTDGSVVDDDAAGAGSAIFTATDPYTTDVPADATSITYIGTVTIAGVEYPAFTVAGGAADGSTIIYSADVMTTGGAGGTIVAPATVPTVAAGVFVVCFAAGTEIATADGVALVEDLQIGDMIRTLDGRDVAVKWVGRQTVSSKFGPAARLLPVKIAAGALGGGLPTSDLTVTSDHALLIGDTLCAAGALVNGTTIARTDLGETFTVYHVETEEHEVIVANGAATETFIDNVARTAFDNFAEFDALYGDVAEMKELGYPRAMTARQVPAAIKAALAGEKAA